MWDIQIDKVLSPSECDELVSWFEAHPQKKHVDVGNDVLYSRHGTGGDDTDTSRYRCDYILTYDRCEFNGTPFQTTVDRMLQNCSRTDITFDWASVVSTYPGCGMAMHKDRATVDTYNSQTTARVYTCILYLNDDYGGGQLVVPPILRYKPSVGSMVQMVGSERLHGVEQITGSKRYTLSLWFTIKDV